MKNKGLHIEILGSTLNDVFHTLTYPAYRSLLTDPRPSLLRVGVRDADDNPIGLALAMEGPEPQWELLSLYIMSWYRSEQLENQLLEIMQSEMLKRRRTQGCHFYTIDKEDYRRAKRLIDCGWSKPMVRQMMCYCSVERAMQTPWLTRSRLSKGYQIISWDDLGCDQRRTIKGLKLSDPINPIKKEKDRSRETSLALLRGTEPVGWVITHQLNPDLLRWTCSYVLSQVQSTGKIFPLWLETVKRQRSKTKMTRFVWTVPLTQPRMISFALRRMQPWLTHLSYACVSTCEKHV